MKKMADLLLITDWLNWLNTSVSHTEREEGLRLFKRTILRVLIAVGLPVGAITAIVLTIGGSQVTGQAPPLVAGTGDTIKAFEPGTGFNVLDYCKMAKTVYVDNTPVARDSLGVKRIAANVKDTDYIEWIDGGNNTAATRYYVDKQGQNAHELVQVVDAAAVQCMRTQK